MRSSWVWVNYTETRCEKALASPTIDATDRSLDTRRTRSHTVRWRSTVSSYDVGAWENSTLAVGDGADRSFDWVHATTIFRVGKCTAITSMGVGKRFKSFHSSNPVCRICSLSPPTSDLDSNQFVSPMRVARPSIRPTTVRTCSLPGDRTRSSASHEIDGVGVDESQSISRAISWVHLVLVDTHPYRSATSG